jgi:hypothetical protein
MMVGSGSLLGRGVQLGVGVGRLALRPAAGAVDLGQRVGTRVALDALDAVLASALAEAAADRVLASPLAEHTITRAVNETLATDVLEQAVQNPDVERVVASLFESHLLDEVVARLLQSEELWRVVDEIARSPAVTDAITQQSFSFADQVAGEVRDRSRSADALVERTTRRLLRRRPRPGVA